MVDLTKNDKEKETYIVDLQTVEDTKQIQVTFADGENSFSPFSVHNYMTYLQRMKNQYLTFGPSFYDQVRVEDSLFISALLRDTFFTILWLINVVRNPENISIKIFLILLLTLQLLLDIPLFCRLRKLHLKKRKLDIMKKFMENKDFYTILVDHPTTGEKVKWPIIHLGNIDQFSTIESLDEFANNLTEEEKEKQRVNTEQFLLKLSEKRE